MGDAIKLNGAEVAPDAWIEGVESAEFKTLIDAKQSASGEDRVDVTRLAYSAGAGRDRL